MEDIEHSIWCSHEYDTDRRKPPQDERPIWQPSASNERWMGY
jgi:hypothetical protein